MIDEDNCGPVITPDNIHTLFREYTDIRDTILFIRYLGGPDPSTPRERNYLLNDNPTNLKVRVLDIMIYPDRREWNILALIIEGPEGVKGGEFSFYYPRDEFRLYSGMGARLWAGARAALASGRATAAAYWASFDKSDPTRIHVPGAAGGGSKPEKAAIHATLRKKKRGKKSKKRRKKSKKRRVSKKRGNKSKRRNKSKKRRGYKKRRRSKKRRGSKK